MMTRTFQRVTPTDPCPVCGKRDWCLRTGDDSAAICQRIADGAVKRCGEAGWLHRFGLRDGWHGPAVRTLTVPVLKGADDSAWRDLAAKFQGAADLARVGRLAGLLGVRAESLRRLGVGWCSPSRAWSFPMVDAAGRIRGIRLRTTEGRKFAVRGGHDGLFIPEGMDASKLLLICEGPTDSATLLDLGFEVVGRPSCTGGSRLLTDLIRRDHPWRVVIVADRDEPGRRGAELLAGWMSLQCPTCVIAPPDGVKDARDWVRSGATRDDVLAAIEAAPVRRLAIRMAIRRRRYGR